MLFNSLVFLCFLCIAFPTYWALHKRVRAQNAYILLLSYIFYGWWDWRFLGLIVASSLLDYAVGLAMARSEQTRRRRALLAVSLSANLGALFFFKYCNFFIENFVAMFAQFGVTLHTPTLQVILPVGISFYTFQTLSYTIDIYRGKLEPTRSIVNFLAYVSFFPQLVAGPIERASALLPQFHKARRFDPTQASDGLRQIMWGLYKKMVIADNCAIYVDRVWAMPIEQASTSSLWMAALLFSFQIYCDFSGYSDIAIGTARLFGFDLMRNFAYPYFSRDIAEFWRRWHISLSTWFRDYLYIPLGGSRGGKWMQLRNTMIIFLVSGFWHGARWTFIVWGALNALFFLPLLLSNNNRRHLDVVAQDRRLPSLREAWAIAMTFGLTTLAWVFFRAPDMQHAMGFLRKLFTSLPTTNPKVKTSLLLLIGLLVVVEYIQRKKQHGLDLAHVKPWGRWLCYGLLFVLWFFFAVLRRNTFIYFQF